MCYPTIITNKRTLGPFGQPGAPCAQTWKVELPQDQDFLTWFTTNVQFYSTDSPFLSTFTGAVGT